MQSTLPNIHPSFNFILKRSLKEYWPFLIHFFSFLLTQFISIFFYIKMFRYFQPLQFTCLYTYLPACLLPPTVGGVWVETSISSPSRRLTSTLGSAQWPAGSRPFDFSGSRIPCLENGRAGFLTSAFYDEILDNCSLLLTLGAQMIYIQNVSQSGNCPVDHVCILLVKFQSKCLQSFSCFRLRFCQTTF